jgi:hypothetical protein
MEKFRLALDIANSIALLIAIVGGLIVTYRWIRKPLVIKRIVVHRKPDGCNYILIVRNRKDYPVTIKSSRCYTRKKFTLMKYRGEKPEFMEGFPLEAQIFSDNTEHVIEPFGNTDVKIAGAWSDDVEIKLILFFHTSHGAHESVFTGEVVVVDMRQGEARHLKVQREYNSKLKAKLRFTMLKIVGR